MFTGAGVSAGAALANAPAHRHEGLPTGPSMDIEALKTAVLAFVRQHQAWAPLVGQS